MREEGIWVRILTADGNEVTGFVAGAESPNDFWTAFKTQCVRVDEAVVTTSDGRKSGFDTLHVNRDAIQAAAVLPREP